MNDIEIDKGQFEKMKTFFGNWKISNFLMDMRGGPFPVKCSIMSSQGTFKLKNMGQSVSYIWMTQEEAFDFMNNEQKKQVILEML